MITKMSDGTTACPFKFVVSTADNRITVIAHSPTLIGAITQLEAYAQGAKAVKGEVYHPNKCRPQRCSLMGKRDSLDVIYDDRPDNIQLKRIRLDHFQKMLYKPHAALLAAVAMLLQVDNVQPVR